MKPLIQAIPSKKLTVHGKTYDVYEPVDHSTRFIRFYVNHVHHLQHIRTFSRVKDVFKREKMFYDHLDGLIQVANRRVEQLYQGDKLRWAVEDGKYSIRPHSEGRLRVTFCYHCPDTMVRRKAWLHAGRHGEASPEQIEEAVNLAKQIRLEKNTQYNKNLKKKREEYRRMVEQQIYQREIAR